MMALLVAMGSMGDTLPFFSLGKALADRGHDVTIAASGYFKNRIESEGLHFIDSWPEEEYRQFLKDQPSWSDLEALRKMGDILLGLIEKVYKIVAENYVPGETVVAAQGYAFGARIAQEKHGVPLATVHLQPMWFRSIHDAPDKPAWFPDILAKGIDRFLDFVIDLGLAPPTNKLRAELGLPKTAKVMKGWWNSPQLVLGFFPEWFNPPQPDWPPNYFLPGFPIYEGPRPSFDSAEVDEYLSEGTPPLVFSQSSITSDTKYFEVSAEVAHQLGRRTVFLAPHKEQLPPSLPDHVKVFSFVPLDHLLPRSALHVHHGGIGTIGHTLWAGIPQLTVPMVYDQPDNSRRLFKLGISGFLKRKAYKPKAVAKEIARLLDSQDIIEKCRDYGRRCRESRALEQTCMALERLEGKDLPAR